MAPVRNTVIIPGNDNVVRIYTGVNYVQLDYYVTACRIIYLFVFLGLPYSLF
jgi:hypothetical protein